MDELTEEDIKEMEEMAEHGDDLDDDSADSEDLITEEDKEALEPDEEDDY